MEPKYPGLVERYVNLGDCYDRAGLQPLRQELMGCMKGYKACYQRAYRCLTAAAQIGEDLRSLLLTPALEAKMAKRAFSPGRSRRGTARPAGRCSASWAASRGRGYCASLRR